MKILNIPQNLVLVMPDKDFSDWSVKGINGESLIIPNGPATKNDPFETNKHIENRENQAKLDAAQHVSVSGIVIKTPDTLVYNGSLMEKIIKAKGISTESAREVSELRALSMQFNVPMELVAGDRVFFKYIEHYNCFKESRVVMDGGEKHILMPYDSLIMAIRDDHPVMLNGLMLVEPVMDSNEQDAITSAFSKAGKDGLLKPMKKELKGRKAQIGVVRNIGSACAGYLNYANEFDPSGIKVGDFIVFDPRYALSLEHEYHRTFHKKRLIRMQRKDIFAVLGNEESFLDLDKFKLYTLNFKKK